MTSTSESPESAVKCELHGLPSACRPQPGLGSLELEERISGHASPISRDLSPVRRLSITRGVKLGSSLDMTAVSSAKSEKFDLLHPRAEGAATGESKEGGAGPAKEGDRFMRGAQAMER
jgi:hypothetical protein